MESLEEFLQTASILAREAGQMMVESRQKAEFKVETKRDPRDVVTETDRAVEKFIFDSLKKQYPKHCFIGEESAGTSGKLDSDDPTWIVDPIDGTMNFIHNSPWCCVSIGLAIERQLVLGVIYAPFINRFYSATKGGGAWCNGQPISVSKHADRLENSLVLGEVYFGNRQRSEWMTRLFDSVIWKCQAYRYVGSACISLCLLAEGSADIFFHPQLCIWDMAAGAVIVSEAGGTLLTFTGELFDPNVSNVLAAANAPLAHDTARRIALTFKSGSSS